MTMKPFMRVAVLCAAAAVEPALAGPETLLTCAEGTRPAVAWSVPGAGIVCHQTVSGLDIGLTGQTRGNMAAFQGNALVALRPDIDAYVTPGLTPTFQPGDWTETGSTGVPGELWWGRTANRQAIVGQESYLRLTKLTALSPAQMPAMRDYAMRRALSVAHRQPMVYKPGDEPFILFQKARIVYAQHAATTADFRGGHGGDGMIPSVKPANARLELQTRPVIKGVLRFDLAVDGQTRQFAIPLRAGSDMEQLRARVSDDDAAPVCAGATPYTPLGRDTCFVPNSVTWGTGQPLKEFYDAAGAFYGDHAGWVAIQYSLTVNSPSRNRAGDTARGILVLKAQ
jgi:hypothetical protein